MNQQKQKYALERVQGIYAQKVEEIENKYTTPDVTLTKEERCKLLKSGTIKVKKGITRIDTWSDVMDVFDFSKHESEGERDNKKIDTEVTKLRIEYNKVRDEIVLGDEEEALKLIQAFDK